MTTLFQSSVGFGVNPTDGRAPARVTSAPSVPAGPSPAGRDVTQVTCPTCEQTVPMVAGRLERHHNAKFRRYICPGMKGLEGRTEAVVVIDCGPYLIEAVHPYLPSHRLGWALPDYWGWTVRMGRDRWQRAADKPHARQLLGRLRVPCELTEN